MTANPQGARKAGKAGSGVTGPTKLDRLIELLSRSQGATLDEMTKLTGWQTHSVRGALAGAIKKRGHSVASEKQDGVRRYRIG